MKNTFYLIILIISFFFAQNSSAQCTNGNLVGNIVPTATWQSTSTTGINGRRYWTFAATAGFTYYFSFCAADGGSSTYDTQITILDNLGVPVAGGFNDDFCGTQSYIAWTCITAGTYRVLVTKFSCANQNGLGTFVYKSGAPLSCPNNMGGGVVTVPSLPYSSGAGTTCGTGNDLTSSNIISCGSASYFDGEDRVWIFTPSTTGTVTINLTSAGTYTGLALYDGCPLLGQGGVCLQVAQSSSGDKTITACLSANKTYYLILDSWPNPTCNAYTNLTISAPVTGNGCALGTGVNAITLPYSSAGRTTCGKLNDITSNNTIACGSSLYYTGEDEVFTFTPAASGNISISLTSSGSYTGLTLYDGCPLTSSCSGTGGSCVAFEQSSTGSKSLCANVNAGKTYYLIIDSWASPACNPYSIAITAPSGVLQGATCASSVAIGTLPFTGTGESTACLGNEYTNASTGSCGTFYESGEDKVYSYVAAGPECLSITLTGASTNSIGFQVYNGCPGTAGTACIGSAGGASSGTLTGSITLPSAGTYFIIVDTWANPVNAQYNISISSFGQGAINDLPCNATPLLLGIPINGANNCSGGASEPAAPACWLTPNNLNTVWYSAVAPASGQLRVRVVPNSLTNPQVAVYSGICGTAMTLVGCNDDGAPCGTTTNYSSDITINGLTAGATYYIVVDGYSSAVGTYSVMAVDASIPLTPLNNGQDCGIYLPVCDTTMSFGNPGFQSFGNICDFPGGGTNCLLSGERSTVWFEIPILANGNLEFSIVPKDWAGAPSTVCTDYDFAVWKTAGTGAVTCAQIATGATPVSCNYNFLGITGCFSTATGVSPTVYPGFGTAFNAGIPVAAGEKYVLVVSNFTNSTSGFDIIFSNASPINYAATGTRSNWSGGIDNDWFKSDNWGGCPVPSCSKDAIIPGGIVNQPMITSLVANCKNIVINPGATLTMNAGSMLTICENFTNYGSFNAATTSTVLLSNAAVNQNLDGNLLAPNAFGNVTITKTGGTVSILQNAEARGDFSVTNNTSVFTMNTKNLKVGGNFSNLGNFIPSTGVLEFNGTAAQTYSNTGLNGAEVGNVKMNHTSTGLTLLTNMVLNTTGSLDLTLGRIITNAFEVSAKNRASASVNIGNTSSFVQGKLRRYLNTLGAYDFPVGEATKGYQRANLNFNNNAFPTAIDNILSNFALHPVLPVALGVTECGTTYSTPSLNNGFWNFIANANPTSGKFDLTLYNLNYTNAAGRWTIQANSGTAWVLAPGTCVVSPVTAVQRLAVSGVAPFSTAQGPSPLAMQLMSFDANVQTAAIELKWMTNYLQGNLQGFELYRSKDANSFVQIAWIDQSQGLNFNAGVRYNFIDNSIELNKRYYYQLAYVDDMGQKQYSSIQSAIINGNNSEFKLAVFPNPVKENMDIVFELEDDSKVTIEIFDQLGKAIMIDNSLFYKQGLNKIHLEKSQLQMSAGIYSVRLLSEGKSELIKVMVE
jgi:hypothetical protein